MKEKKTKNKGRQEFEMKSVQFKHSFVLKLFLSFFIITLLTILVTALFLIKPTTDIISGYLPSSEIIILKQIIRKQFFFILLFVIVPSIGLSFMLANYIARPVRRLKKSMREVFRGNFSAEVPSSRKDELGQMLQLFNSTLRKLKEIDERNRVISQVKSQFVTVAAHQLGTPASSARWALQYLLSGKLGPLTEEQKQLIERCMRSNDQLARIIGDLLNVARLEEGKFGYEFSDVNIVEVVETLIKEFELQADKNGVRLEFRNAAGESLTITADRKRLIMVISTLIDNAIRYSRRGGVVSISLSLSKEAVELEVRDEGIGIPESEKNQIFSVFFRASNAIVHQPFGNGLGLYISRQIVNRHKGRISFISDEGKGTTFYMSVPLKKETASLKEPIEAFMEAI